MHKEIRNFEMILLMQVDVVVAVVRIFKTAAPNEVGSDSAP